MSKDLRVKETKQFYWSVPMDRYFPFLGGKVPRASFRMHLTKILTVKTSLKSPTHIDVPNRGLLTAKTNGSFVVICKVDTSIY